MSKPNTSVLSDAAIMTRAIENVLRKFIRILIGKISLKRLQEMMQIIFIEEVEKQLRKEEPGKSVALSNLAVMTGFDTRTIAKIRDSEFSKAPLHTERRFLRTITPECCVMDVWESSADYIDLDSGEPKVLDIVGSKNSFQTLVAESISTRGVTASSILRRLEACNSVLVDLQENKVKMISRGYQPFTSGDQVANIEVGLAAVGNLLDTIIYNLRAQTKKERSFYQRGCWTNRLEETDRHELRENARSFLAKADRKARAVIRPFERKESNERQITAGISMFYFEEFPED